MMKIKSQKYSLRFWRSWYGNFKPLRLPCLDSWNTCFSFKTTIEAEHSISALSYDHYLPILSLVEYHQMETRVALRLVILQIFGVMCSLSKTIVSTLLVTVLPLELSMDVMSHTESMVCHNNHEWLNYNLFCLDTQRTCYSALVMSMLFSTAEPLPVGHYGEISCYNS